MPELARKPEGGGVYWVQRGSDDIVLRSDPRVVVDDGALSALALRHGIQELALFGSVLRSDFRPWSDVDCLVTFYPSQPVMDLLDFIAVQRELEDLLQRPVDLVPAPIVHKHVWDDMLAETRVIYVGPSRAFRARLREP